LIFVFDLRIVALVKNGCTCTILTFLVCVLP
jgi:hypothetical protein